MLAWILNIDFAGSGVPDGGAPAVSGLMLLGVGLLRLAALI